MRTCSTSCSRSGVSSAHSRVRRYVPAAPRRCGGSCRPAVSAVALPQPGRSSAAASAPAGGSPSFGLEPQSSTTSPCGRSWPPGRSAGSGGSPAGRRLSWPRRSRGRRSPVSSTFPVTRTGASSAATMLPSGSRMSSPCGGICPLNPSFGERRARSASAGSRGPSGGGTSPARSQRWAEFRRKSASSTMSIRPEPPSMPRQPVCEERAQSESKSSPSLGRSASARVSFPAS